MYDKLLTISSHSYIGFLLAQYDQDWLRKSTGHPCCIRTTPKHFLEALTSMTKVGLNFGIVRVSSLKFSLISPNVVNHFIPNTMSTPLS